MPGIAGIKETVIAVQDARRSQWDIIIFLSGVLAVVLLDRLTKNFFSGFLDLNESIAVIPTSCILPSCIIPALPLVFLRIAGRCLSLSL
jgi:hypothetical protein